MKKTLLLAFTVLVAVITATAQVPLSGTSLNGFSSSQSASTNLQKIDLHWGNLHVAGEVPMNRVNDAIDICAVIRDEIERGIPIGGDCSNGYTWIRVVITTIEEEPGTFVIDWYVDGELLGRFVARGGTGTIVGSGELWGSDGQHWIRY